MASGTPERCTACDAVLPPGSAQCTSCGKVYGEHNRCPSCHAIAAVRQDARGAFVCAACGAPRERHRDTPLESTHADALSRGAWWRRLLAWMLAPLGVSSLSFGALVALGGGALLSGGFATASAILGGVFAALGAGALLFAYQLSRRAGVLSVQARREKLLAQVTRAPEAGLTAGQAAAPLRMRAAEADATLTELAKEGRLDVHVDAAGTLRYRVAAPSEAVEEFEEALERAKGRAELR